MTTKEQIEYYLRDLPSKWREQLTEILCDIKEDRNKPSCETIKGCETLTSLSDFAIDSTNVGIVYTDERGVQTTRSFDVAEILNTNLDGIEPGCLTTSIEWADMTFLERMQLLIDKHCECCE